MRSAWRSEVQPDAHPRHSRKPARGPALRTLPGRQPLQHGAAETFTCLRSPPRPLQETPWQIRAWQRGCASRGSEPSRPDRAGLGPGAGVGVPEPVRPLPLAAEILGGAKAREGRSPRSWHPERGNVDGSGEDWTLLS